MKGLLRISCLAALLVVAGHPAFSQDYPSRPVKLVVPFPAGSATDNTARFLAERLSADLKQSVIVENRAGADGKIAAQYVARSDPDGYNVLLGTNTTHSGNLAFSKSLPYDPVRDFIPIGGVFRIPLLLTVALEFPANDVQGFVKHARERELSYGNHATSPRIAAEFLALSTGIKLKNVPYRGSPQALADLMGGRIDLVFSDPSSAQGLLESGKVKVLGATGRTRLSSLPNVPTLSEAGVPDYELVSWIGAFVPTGTPQPIVDKLSTSLEKIIRSDETRTYFSTVSAQPFPMKPKEMAQYIDEDIVKWAKIVKAAGIEPQ